MSDKNSQDVVVLHEFPRAINHPNASPYPIKMETYFRMADIDYVPDWDRPRSSKGKTPWITFRGKEVADSQISLEYVLSKLPEKDISAHLSPEQKAIGRSFRVLLEDHFFFILLLYRFVYGDLKFLNEIGFPTKSWFIKFLQSVVLYLQRWHMWLQAYFQGIGRHSRDEIREMAFKDLESISNFLGEKPFMMGDKPSEVDCVLFGFSTVVMYGFPDNDELRRLLVDNFHNIVRHQERIKKKYWSDWDQCCFKGKQA